MSGADAHVVLALQVLEPQNGCSDQNEALLRNPLVLIDFPSLSGANL